jgi:hypothetical protein
MYCGCYRSYQQLAVKGVTKYTIMNNDATCNANLITFLFITKDKGRGVCDAFFVFVVVMRFASFLLQLGVFVMEL